MFTSRAEYRTLLRQDNADQRLTPLGHSIGLAVDERLAVLDRKQEKTTATLQFLQQQSYVPSELNPLLQEKGSALVQQAGKFAKVLARPKITRQDLLSQNVVKAFINDNAIADQVFEQAEIQIKYSGYIEKEKQLAQKMQRMDHIKIPQDFNYHQLASLSHEAKEKLSEIQPLNLAQASRISGINPSDISVLLVYLNK